MGRLGVDTCKSLINDLSLDELINLKRSIKITQDALEISSKRYGEEIMSRLCAEGSVEHLTPDGWKAQMLIGRTASSVNVKRLAERGVDPDVIKSCTDDGAEYSYIKIVKVKERS